MRTTLPLDRRRRSLGRADRAVRREQLTTASSSPTSTWPSGWPPSVPVLYVDPPMSRLTARRNPALAACVNGPALRMQAPGLARLTPIVQPFPSRRGMTTLTTALSRTDPAPGDAPVSAATSARSSRPGRCTRCSGAATRRSRVYWAQDDFVGGAELLGLNAARLAAGELRSVRSADLIIAANPAVADSWRARGYDPALIPYGADVAAYASCRWTSRARRMWCSPLPIAGFVGHINSRIDLGLLEAIAARGRSLLLVGPRNAAFEPARWAALVDRPNVQWVGAKPFRRPARAISASSTSAWCRTATARSTREAFP